MKIWISFDMEGVAGIVDWEQCRVGSGEPYALGQRLLQNEVNAAIEGALDAGATEVVLNDSHGHMSNLDPNLIAGTAAYISGRNKPMHMMQGLDGSADAIFFLAYHGAISGRSSVLSHSYNPDVFSAARVNGTPVGESGINALVAQHYGVPIALVTGDSVTQDDTRPFAPDAVEVVTKESITRFSARNLHPDESCRQIREGASEAVRLVSAGRMASPHIELPAVLDLEFRTADLASVAVWAKHTTRTGDRSVRVESENLREIYESFMAINALAQKFGGR
ncbi:M55 family metallopeptidase [Microbacterium sp. MPKO10]|uniref:M55 family metallopeptidase n=1 Tax=Microbacterium sp. MPKO10 TaxID=2989818 RepID=UPI002235A5EE|nr:M55 family metallopeptidase [Microbacterium sp. MPKO10]MCW4456829.1 M55 family metallopeptidase [Microbacterium sp. MPKO10]